MKNRKELEKISKFMSLILRHKPDEIGIILDKNGYTSISILNDKLDINSEELDWIVENNSKKRFAYNEDKTLIRASQGHSIDEVDVELQEATIVPKYLYHGTSNDFVDIILVEGLKKMNRNHVHLSKDEETAIIVGKRKSSNITILKIDTESYLTDGYKIYISKNDVYLVDNVPNKYISK